MTGARFDGTLDAKLLQVGGALFMNSSAQSTTAFKSGLEQRKDQSSLHDRRPFRWHAERLS